ncbi:hypothetical protein SBA2_30131 [Acidobacteriia bacterium SbA2]|nr:hypothetical protein SBA2_30131 [Acidobacteriia bacterium SbA2]
MIPQRCSLCCCVCQETESPPRLKNLKCVKIPIAPGSHLSGIATRPYFPLRSGRLAGHAKATLPDQGQKVPSFFLTCVIFRTF